MANETVLTIVGNLTAAPELMFTNSGIPVASFTVASTPRTFDKQANEWKDGEALFMRCSAWRDLAENVTESLAKGTRVIVQGRLQQRSYTDKEGNQRTTIDLQVDEVGPSLRYATATPVRVANNGYQQNAPTRQAQQHQQAWSQNDTWGNQAQQTYQPQPPANDPWGAPQQEQSPF